MKHIYFFFLHSTSVHKSYLTDASSRCINICHLFFHIACKKREATKNQYKKPLDQKNGPEFCQNEQAFCGICILQKYLVWWLNETCFRYTWVHISHIIWNFTNWEGTNWNVVLNERLGKISRLFSFNSKWKKWFELSGMIPLHPTWNVIVEN